MPRPGWLTLVSGLFLPGVALSSIALSSIALPSIASAADGAEAGYVLQAASGSSPRPTECRATGPDRAYTFWDRARDPRLSRYCNLLAKGYARLDNDAAQALEAAEQAAALEPTRASPRLLQARALVGQGRMAEAYQAFRQVLAPPNPSPAGRSVELSPAALYDYAVAAVGSGQIDEGLAAYRRVVPMASLLTGPGASQRVYVEAAVLVMRQGPAQLQEAVAYLNEARRQNADLVLRPFVLSALALALDRQGRHEEARGVAREAHGHTELLRGGLALPRTDALPGTGQPPVAGQPQPPAAGQPRASAPGAAAGQLEAARVPLPRIDPLELLAMAALLAAGEDVELAKQYWRDFVERAPANHPWLAHARAKLAARD